MAGVTVASSPNPVRRWRLRWVLFLLAALGAGYAVKSLVGSWASLVIAVQPVTSQASAYGFEWFGVWGYGYAGGILLLALVTLVAVFLPVRLRTAATLAGLVLAAVLAIDLLIVQWMVEDVRHDAIRQLTALVERYGEGKPWLVVGTMGLQDATYAVVIFGLVLIQIPWPERGPQIQTGIGIGLGLVSLVLPWVTVWQAQDGGNQIVWYWLWSLGGGGILLTIAMPVVAVVAGLPVFWRRWRVPAVVLFTVAALAFLVFLLPSSLGLVDAVTAEAVRRQWLGVEPGLAVRFMELGALLIAVGTTRLAVTSVVATVRARRGRSNSGRTTDHAGVPVAGSPPWPPAR